MPGFFCINFNYSDNNINIMKKLILAGCLITLSFTAFTPAAPKADKDFEKFWKTLRSAVIGQNRFQVMKLTEFPVANLICSDIEGKTEHDLPECSKEKFKSCFTEIFTRCLRKQFAKNRYAADVVIKDKNGNYQFAADMKFRVNGKFSGEGTVTFTFSKINREYKITRIMCVGGCGGEC